MAFRAFVFLSVLCVLQLVSAKLPPLKLTVCKPRYMDVRFRAFEKPSIRLYSSCDFKTATGSGSTNCGTFENVLEPWCTRNKCAPGVHCKLCGFRVWPHQVDRFYHNLNGTTPELGRYFVEIRGKELCSGFILQFTSDFRESGEDWFDRNGFIAGCKDRVECYSFRQACDIRNPPYDMAVYAQGCQARLYRGSQNTNSAADLTQCRLGNVLKGIPAGEVNGVDCPRRLI